MFDNFLQGLNTPSEHSDTLFELVAEDERKKFVCKHPGCGKFFRYKSEIVRHAATHSESRPFVCQHENCFKAFKRNDALENHIRSSHTKETPFVCPFPECGMKFTTHGSFRYHVLKHNKQLPSGLEASLAHPMTHPQQQLPDAPRKQLKLDPLAETPASHTNEYLKIEVPTEKVKGKADLEEFLAPPLRIAGKIQWEMINDEMESSTPVQKLETVPKEKYDTVVEENQVLKQKLMTSEKVIKTMQKQMGDLLNNLFICQNQLANMSKNYPQNTSPSSSEKLTQESPMERKTEEPEFEMINYGQEENIFRNQSLGLTSPAAEPTFHHENSSIDAFLSFGKELDSFGF